MLEADWLTGTDFAAHARFAAESLSPRRQRLLAVAFCRTIRHLIDHPELIDALATIERYADGRRDASDMEKARQRCREIALESFETYRRQVDGGAGAGAGYERQELAWMVAYAASTPLTVADVGTRAAQAAAQSQTGAEPLSLIPSAEAQAASAKQALVMRAVVWEVVGNPFRPVDFSPVWRTDTVLALATQMYESREFSAMPILADALQDAGCDNEDVLNHCREPGEHVRGCWVVDGVLGKV
jgi:hypothetical protein